MAHGRLGASGSYCSIEESEETSYRRTVSTFGRFLAAVSISRRKNVVAVLFGKIIGPIGPIRRIGHLTSYFEIVEVIVFGAARSTDSVLGMFSVVRSINRSTTAFKSFVS